MASSCSLVLAFKKADSIALFGTVPYAYTCEFRNGQSDWLSEMNATAQALVDFSGARKRTYSLEALPPTADVATVMGLTIGDRVAIQWPIEPEDSRFEPVEIDVEGIIIDADLRGVERTGDFSILWAEAP